MAVSPNPDIMKWAIERCGSDVSSLKKKWPKISMWLDGTAKPSLKQIEAFAKKTHINLNLLFTETTPELGLQIADFRTVAPERKLPSPELYDTINQMLFRQDWMRSYFSEQEYDIVDLVGMFSECDISDKEVKHVADTIREYFDIEEMWAFEHRDYTSALKSLRDCVERKRISVVINGIVGDNTHRKLDVGEFRGFVLSDQRAPIVFINGRDAKTAQIFTLIHELVHLAFASTGVVSSDVESAAGDYSESLCDAIAAEVLVPAVSFSSHWLQGEGTYKDVERLAKLYKVSFATCARRVRDLGFITSKELFRWYERHNDQIIASANRSNGGNYYLTKGYRLGGVFADAVFVAVQARALTYREAYRLTGLNYHTFNEYFKGYVL